MGGLWCGALFLPWFSLGGADGNLTGANMIDSAWLPLVIVAVASVVLLLDAISVDVFRSLPMPAISTFLMPIGLFYTALFLIAGEGLMYGAWTALGLSAAAVVFSAMAWLIDRRG
jgi:tellurite resistance protein TehA-like permease